MNAIKGKCIECLLWGLYGASSQRHTEMGAEVGSYEGGADIASRLGL